MEKGRSKKILDLFLIRLIDLTNLPTKTATHDLVANKIMSIQLRALTNYERVSGNCTKLKVKRFIVRKIAGSIFLGV